MLAEYLEILMNKCEIVSCNKIKKKKINDEQMIIPTFNSYKDLFCYNYNISQLKTIAKNYKLKLSGNKKQILHRIYSYLYLSHYAVKIQKIIRGHLVKNYKKLRGPAINNRKLCTNGTDFITMEPIDEIDYNQFISYKDEDGFIYGFDITSLYNLYSKSSKFKNPYNRNVFPDFLYENLKKIIRISRIIKMKINLIIENECSHLTNEQTLELRALKLFQTMDEIGGHCSNKNWFLSLSRNQLFKFYQELNSIWSIIPLDTRRNVYSTNVHCDPFVNCSVQYIISEDNILNVKKVILEVMEKLVNGGADNDSKCLGIYYILASLTKVNIDAASAMPHLYSI
jgi:hypothetical protein